MDCQIHSTAQTYSVHFTAHQKVNRVNVPEKTKVPVCFHFYQKTLHCSDAYCLCFLTLFFKNFFLDLQCIDFLFCVIESLK